jgi:hypothetical protein
LFRLILCYHISIPNPIPPSHIESLLKLLLYHARVACQAPICALRQSPGLLKPSNCWSFVQTSVQRNIISTYLQFTHAFLWYEDQANRILHHSRSIIQQILVQNHYRCIPWSKLLPWGSIIGAWHCIGIHMPTLNVWLCPFYTRSSKRMTIQLAAPMW